MTPGALFMCQRTCLALLRNLLPSPSTLRAQTMNLRDLWNRNVRLRQFLFRSNRYGDRSRNEQVADSPRTALSFLPHDAMHSASVLSRRKMSIRPSVTRRYCVKTANNHHRLLRQKAAKYHIRTQKYTKLHTQNYT